ncbi:MAG: 2-oxo-4-hydroxy-4-carboxy-5-ureidoimidazoline decarboxylase [Chloroflexota bacterium]
MSTALDLDALNAEDPAAFVTALAPLFEGAPRFLGRLAAHRPFADWPALFERARAVAHAMPEVEQVELIDAHPRLGAPAASVSALSFREQGYDRDRPAAVAAGSPAGAAAESPAELERERVAAAFERLNAAYEARFGFRYCVHVAGRPRAELLPEMEASLQGAPDAERHRALDAVVDIAIDRLSVVLGPMR